LHTYILFALGGHLTGWFFDFFEEFVANRGYDAIVYYAYDPAAVAIFSQEDTIKS